MNQPKPFYELNLKEENIYKWEEIVTIVSDLGSFVSKTGFAGMKFPIQLFASVVGGPKYKQIMVGMGGKDTYVGDEAISKTGILNLYYPIQRGIITNWDDWEKIIHHHFYNELRAAPEEHPMLFIQPPLTSKSAKEKILQIMMETFCVPAFYSANPAVLSLFALGKKTGIVLESGAAVTHCVPVFQGIDLPYQTQKLNLGGNDSSKYFNQLLSKKGYSFENYSQEIFLKEIKEKFAYVSFDFQEEMMLDEKKIQIEKEDLENRKFIFGKELFQVPEILFQPSLFQNENENQNQNENENQNQNQNQNQQKGIPELICDSILKCDKDIQKELMSNIVLSGGSTLFPGFVERLRKELSKSKLFEDLNDINIIAPDERRFLSWIGGSCLGYNSVFEKMWVSNEEYDEYGPTMIHKKCF